MERLSSSQLRAVLTVLQEVAAVRDIDAFANQVMAALSRLVAVDSISYNEVNPVRRRMVSTVHPAITIPSAALDYLAKHLDQHPVIDHLQKTGWGRPLKISDFISQQEFHRRGIYANLYRSTDTEDQLSVTLPAHPPTIVGIALNRGSPSFDERDRLMLDLIRPHLAEAYRTVDLLSRYTTALDRAQVGIVALDESNRILQMNELARVCLDCYFGESGPRSGDLPDSLAAWVQHQEQVGNADDDVPPPGSPLEVVQDRGQLSIRYLRGDEWGNGAMLLLSERRRQPVDERLRALGLSTREIDVLRCVERGQSDREIARGLALSPGTIKKHLEHVYRKLGVSSRTAAIARVRSACNELSP